MWKRFISFFCAYLTRKILNLNSVVHKFERYSCMTIDCVAWKIEFKNIVRIYSFKKLNKIDFQNKKKEVRGRRLFESIRSIVKCQMLNLWR